MPTSTTRSGGHARSASAANGGNVEHCSGAIHEVTGGPSSCSCALYLKLDETSGGTVEYEMTQVPTLTGLWRLQVRAYEDGPGGTLLIADEFSGTGPALPTRIRGCTAAGPPTNPPGYVFYFTFEYASNGQTEGTWAVRVSQTPHPCG